MEERSNSEQQTRRESLQPVRAEAEKLAQQAQTIEPFPEFVLQIMDTNYEFDVRQSSLTRACAYLFLFRSNPQRLQRLVQLWRKYSPARLGNNIDDDDNDDNDDDDDDDEEADGEKKDSFSSYALGVLQQCAEVYFSYAWHLQDAVIRSNKDAREYYEHLGALLIQRLGRGDECGNNSNSSSKDDNREGRHGISSDDVAQAAAAASAASPAAAAVCGVKTSSFPSTPLLTHTLPYFTPEKSLRWACHCDIQRLNADERHKGRRAVIVFHAAFSKPSCQLLRELSAIEERVNGADAVATSAASAKHHPQLQPNSSDGDTPTQVTTGCDACLHVDHPTRIAGRSSGGERCNTLQSVLDAPSLSASATCFGVVNCAREYQLRSEFGVTWYPTVMLRTRRGTWVKYPEAADTSTEALATWIAEDGSEDNKRVPSAKRASLITKAILLTSAKLKFATLRELKSAVTMLHRLQCVGDECSERVRDASPDDPPTFIFLGGGMASGKTTAVAALTRSDWWRAHGGNTVIVDADDFKQQDPLFALHSRDLHEKSVRSAEQLLVMAINQGRDIVFDGTMSWAPYVLQTIDMVRNAAEWEYRLGEGYNPAKNVENYWEKDVRRQRPLPVPYRVRLIGITVDPGVAVPRAIIRRLTQGRGVPVKAQLRSFKLFSEAFEEYAARCDEVLLYNNNIWIDLDKEVPRVCAHRDFGTGKMTLDDPEAYAQFLDYRNINADATSVETLFLSNSTTSSP